MKEYGTTADTASVHAPRCGGETGPCDECARKWAAATGGTVTAQLPAEQRTKD